MTRWIVDGMNVIGSRPDGWWRDRAGAMRELVAALDSFAERRGEPVAVVLDGRAFELPARLIEVRFASRRGPNAADDDIVELVRSAPDPGELTVVTSDAGLAARARESGAAVVGAGGFRREQLDG